MHSEPIHLVIAINQKYIRYAYVMLTSLLLHTSCDVHVYVLHRELNAADQQTFDTLTHSYPVTFHFIHVPDALLPPQKVLATSAWGAEAYFRLAITDLMPSCVDRALYLDTDMIVNQSIDDFYFCNLKGKKIAACAEIIHEPPFGNYRDELFAPLFSAGFSYFNSGTILYDLRALRTDCSFQTYMDLAEKLDYRIQFPDQDLLNYRHSTETLFVDPLRYNLNARYAYDIYSMRYDDMKQNACIIHYATSKPWRGNFVHYNVEQIWWDYAKQTPFYTELLQEALEETLTNTAVNSYITNLLEQNEALYACIEKYDQLLSDAGITL